MAELFTYRVATVPTPGVVEVPHRTEHRWMNLYCWPCRTVHQFGLKDVEKIVYALGANAVLAYELGRLDEAAKNPEQPSDSAVTCLKTVLRDANSPEVFIEHVEQGIECREAHE
jgi:hypothetical protein